MHKFLRELRGPKRSDFFEVSHFMFDTQDEEGIIAPRFGPNFKEALALNSSD